MATSITTMAGKTVDSAEPGSNGMPALDDPALYINRELSQIEFDRRVLALTRDPAIPVLERLRFMTICSTNLDEFFEIRVAGLKQQVQFRVTQKLPDGLTPHEALDAISKATHAFVAEQYRVLHEELYPALADKGIRVVKWMEWTPAQAAWAEEYFMANVLPVLTPIGLDPSHPFPRILNKSLNFMVTLSGVDAFGREIGVAVVQVPRSLPRTIPFPRDLAGGPYEFALLSGMVHANIGRLFPGMEITGCYQFRVTRNSDLYVDEEETDDMLHAIAAELRTRSYGGAVRLEVADDCTEEMANFLLAQFELQPRDLYRVNGPVNLHRLSALYNGVDKPECKYPPFSPGTPFSPGREQDMFELIRQGDVLLHHPYQSFSSVLELLRQAAADPNVLAIKQTVYRTGEKSAVVAALLDAARAGKEVTAIVELRARFDEAANIDLATRLQEAGATVAYGIVGYKAHAKMLLIVRREGDRIRRYVHLGTGNYHPGTARGYTDFCLMTCNEQYSEDVHHVFQQLTGLGKVARLHKLLQTPFTLHAKLLELIDAEAAAAAAGKPAHIMAKLNALSEPSIIQALYRASQAGVQIDLVIRGICCLRPGVPGISDNIRVRSILGRFLEHSRIYYFLAGGRELVYCSSADWMQRNVFRRVEVAFPVEEEKLKRRVIDEGLTLALEDTASTWTLQSDGSYVREEVETQDRPDRKKTKSLQATLLTKLAQ